MSEDSTPHPKSYSIDFEPIGRRVEIHEGESLLSAAQTAGVQIISLCGGVGSCDSCQVRLVFGELSPPTLVEQTLFSEEDLSKGYRLACQAIPVSDVKIDVPPESLTTTQRLQIEGQEIMIDPDPVVLPVDLQLDPPTLEDLRSDITRLHQTLENAGVKSPKMDLPTLEVLSDRIRDQNWEVRLALRGDEIVASLTPESDLLGLAVDVGTTKLAAYLVDLATGNSLAKTGSMNPQISYGEDVVSRIAYTNDHEGGRKLLQKALVEAINEMLIVLHDEAGTSHDQVVEAVVVGNTAMHHLFSGLPVRQLGMAPYVPAISDSMEISASGIGLAMAPGAYIHLPPNIAGYVGADHVAMLLSTEVWQSEGNVLALDIGTNTEISLVTGGRLLCCSCASGPAFEGAHIHDGMRAAPGAIERVQISDGEVRVHTIGDQPAVGICGSGILDVMAEMVAAGVMNTRGKLLLDHPLVLETERDVRFLLVPAESTGHDQDITVIQKDVGEVQLAKGAIRAGIEILLEAADLAYDAIEEFVVAGAFGTYLDIHSAIQIGMFPQIPVGRFRQVGNAAGTGARQMLISSKRREMTEEIAARVEYLELTTHPNFTAKFMNAMNF
jgi:uncharacterized 2Fe-2S/4Fe-4S cluster protein (DUF4445 family)